MPIRESTKTMSELSEMCGVAKERARWVKTVVDLIRDLGTPPADTNVLYNLLKRAILEADDNRKRAGIDLRDSKSPCGSSGDMGMAPTPLDRESRCLT